MTDGTVNLTTRILTEIRDDIREVRGEVRDVRDELRTGLATTQCGLSSRSAANAGPPCAPVQLAARRISQGVGSPPDGSARAAPSGAPSFKFFSAANHVVRMVAL